MPLPGTRTIHGRWSEHHQTTVGRALTSICRITRADGVGVTETDGTWIPGPRLTLYDGPARIVRVGLRDEHTIQGEERLTTRRYQIQISIESPEIFTGDSMEVLSSNDSVLTGKKLRIIGILVGSETWSRDMIAIEFEEGT